MDKWRSNGRPVVIIEDSLLPPTRRIANLTPPPLQDKRRSKKWSIDGFFKKVSSILDVQSSSSSVEDSSESQRKIIKGKSKTILGIAGYGSGNRENSGYLGVELNGNTMSQSLEVLGGNRSQSRSSDGSLDGPQRRVRKDRVKARAEAKRDRLCIPDSSPDESSSEEPVKQHRVVETTSKRRTRASRTERYLKRICNGNGYKIGYSDTRNPDSQPHRLEDFRPIETVPTSDYPHRLIVADVNNGDACRVPTYDNGTGVDNPYTRQGDIGVNPLVQQTLQYFSEFDRNMAAQQHKTRKSYPSHQHQRRVAKPKEQSTHPQNSTVTPPKPPSRDHTSRILVNGTSLDKYQRMLKYVHRPPEQQIQNLDKENGFYGATRSTFHSPNAEVNNINEGRGFSLSPTSTMHKYSLPLSPPRSPLKESFNTTAIGGSISTTERKQSPILDVNKPEHVERSSPHFKPILEKNDYENLNYVRYKKPETAKHNERRSSKNLEEALCELEAIYNSLQLGDEELLERAEKRTMEEFHYKGFTVSPDFNNEDPSSRRKTWGDAALDNYKEDSETPDRLKDDMAYRRMHPKERPSSVDGQSSLSSISYLMTSPISSRREMCYIDPNRKSRRKEPDVTLDDVVFRSMQYANNTLKVVDPQPPFGIPLGPITTATDSDYLHTNPTKLERARSPYIPSCEPDLVNDDLAFRNLRKDALLSNNRQPSPSLIGSGGRSPVEFGHKPAGRSLSATFYGQMKSNRPQLDSEDSLSLVTNSMIDDLFEDVPIKRINRRTSDPEIIGPGWQKNTWKNLDVNRNRNKEQRIDNSSDIIISSSSCEDLPDDRIRLHERLALPESEYKAGSDKGSSYLSSNCSTPPPVPIREPEPFTEQEISVYKKLCQDLENLVKLTKGTTDHSSRMSEVVDPPTTDLKDHHSKTKMSNQSVDQTIVENSFKVGDEEKREESPIKREISTILDNLRILGEESNRSNSSCSDKELVNKEKSRKEATAEKKALCEITKETSDLVVEDKIKPVENISRVRKDEEERRDSLDDNVFFRNVHLAKLSGDWKESTPNGALDNRRSNFADVGWEGMKKCNHKYNSMPAKTSSLLPFRNFGSKRKSSNRKSMCSIS